MTHFARRLFVVALLGGLTLWVSDSAPARQGNGAAIRVDKIKYTDLGQLVRSKKGNVVVVDFWATNCVPCVREFPRLVQLSNKYKNDSLVAISVSVDDPADPQKPMKILTFLEKQKADQVTNLHLDEKGEVWMQKLGISGVPCVYVFNQEGHIAGKWSDDTRNVDYDEIEKMVAELMKK